MLEWGTWWSIDGVKHECSCWKWSCISFLACLALLILVWGLSVGGILFRWFWWRADQGLINWLFNFDLTKVETRHNSLHNAIQAWYPQCYLISFDLFNVSYLIRKLVLNFIHQWQAWFKSFTSWLELIFLIWCIE